VSASEHFELKDADKQICLAKGHAPGQRAGIEELNSGF